MSANEATVRRAPAQTRPSAAPSGEGRRRRLEMLVHLTKREVASRQRWTLLGWAWPLTRQLAQLAVLVFVFSSIFDVNIEDFPAFVFIGLLAFSWFAAGLAEAAGSLLAWRHLALSPRFPSEVLPIVALAIPFVDVLLGLPVLAVLLVVSGNLSVYFLLFPLLLAVQFLLMAGLAWFLAAAAAYLRDIPNVVTVATLILFYLTPVFYSLEQFPEKYRWIIRLNPLTTLVESYRDVLLRGQFPPPLHLLAVTVGSVALAIGGLVFFNRRKHDLVDEL